MLSTFLVIGGKMFGSDVSIKNGRAEVPYEKYGLGIDIIEENIGDPIKI